MNVSVSWFASYGKGNRVRRRDLIIGSATAGTLLAGCSAASGTGTDVSLAPGMAVALPSPASLDRALEATQFVVARYGSRTISFEGRISATPARFSLLCLDPAGREAMRIVWTADGITAARAAFVPDDLRAENMLADLVLLYWPEPVVRQAVSTAGGELLVSAVGRSVRAGGTDIICASLQPLSGTDPWNGKAAYRNLVWDYALTIQSRVLMG